MRYKLIISYDGSMFNGYQIQESGRTIQGELTEAVKLVAKEETSIHASGRTDAGVHAKGQVLHFDVALDISALDMKSALNSVLPDDIYVLACTRVSQDFHSRFNAKSKKYEYLINTGEYNPLLRNYVLQFCRELDVEKMEEAIKYFIGEHDFTSFTTGVRGEDKDCVRTIYSANINVTGTRISIKFHGTGFLRYMVRGIVGTLIDVGSGKIEPEKINEILLAKNRSAAGPNADACGLYLSEVVY